MSPKDQIKNDVDAVIKEGDQLLISTIAEADPESLKNSTKAQIKKLPHFRSSYEPWYSKALACVRQLLPERLEDFQSYYRAPRPRSEVKLENYVIRDYLKGLSFTIDKEGASKALCAAFSQQLAIVEAAKMRFETSIYDIKTLLEADIFDSEIEAATELNSKGFDRGAGAVAGVVLESHLATVCDQHSCKVKGRSTISKLNDALKNEGVIDIPTWRFVQHLGDLRNLCDHKGDSPGKKKVDELIEGVQKIIKTVL